MSLQPRIKNSLENATRGVLLEFLRDGRCTQAEYEGWSAVVPTSLASLSARALDGLVSIEDHAGLARITATVPVGAQVATKWQDCTHSLVNVRLGYAHNGHRESLHERTFLLNHSAGTTEGACTAWNYSALVSASETMQHHSTAEKGANTEGDQAANGVTAPSRAGKGTVFIAYEPA